MARRRVRGSVQRMSRCARHQSRRSRWGPAVAGGGEGWRVSRARPVLSLRSTFSVLELLLGAAVFGMYMYSGARPPRAQGGHLILIFGGSACLRFWGSTVAPPPKPHSAYIFREWEGAFLATS